MNSVHTQYSPNDVHHQSNSAIYNALMENVAKFPSKIAIKTTSGKTATYEEIRRQADVIARNLGKRGIVSGDTIAVYLSNSIEYISFIFGVAKMGVAYVPIMSNFDQNCRCYAFDIAKPVLVLSDDSRDVETFGIPLVSLLDIIDKTVPIASDVIPISDNIFRRLWSSGSTGFPKMIAWKQAPLVSERKRWNNYIGVNSSDIFFCRHPLDVAHATDLHIFSALFAGASCIIDDQNLTPFSLWQFLCSSNASILSALPEHYQQWVDAAPAEGYGCNHSIRLALCGGTYLRSSTIESARSSLGLELAQLYGSTEFGLALVNLQPKKSDGMTLVADVHARLDSAEILNKESYQIGELVLISSCTSEGYIGNPIAHANTFVNNEFWTGDIAIKSPQGTFQIVGRKGELLRTKKGLCTAPELDAKICALAVGAKIVSIITQSKAGENTAITFCETAMRPVDEILDVERVLNELSLTLDVRIRLVPVDRIPYTEVGKPDKALLRRNCT